ncbi:MAG TPA: homoserine dehydrogenase [Candidatus Binataceae bacterium]|nr:homoserine dehydrogenase [Candidatus Binataceae bacterium]
MNEAPVRIALLGCGTIGTGVVKLLRSNGAMLAERVGAPLELTAVVDKLVKPNASLGITRAVLNDDPHTLVTRPDIDIVVELFGGIEPAKTLILKALNAGKDVVTANKALLAEHGGEIFHTVGKTGRALGFEASVGGGIPIIRTLRQALAGDRQRAVYGIVNGTCNSILSAMTEQNLDFDVALKDAQRAGLAEADPTLDIGGHDAAHKLCLLVTLAFGALIKPNQVHTEGISGVTRADIAFARELGCTIKLLAIAKDDNGVIEARVHPTMIPSRHVLASVSGAYNAIYIHGEALGSTMYLGLGAGQMPTATAVMADIIEIARDRRFGGDSRSHALGYPFERIRRARVKPMADVVCEYYLRFIAADKPGVLGRIASILGRNGISIASVIQEGRAGEGSVPVVMRSHEAREKNLMKALGEISRSRIISAAPAYIRIEERL